MLKVAKENVSLHSRIKDNVREKLELQGGQVEPNTSRSEVATVS